jgi:mono/diheme cytochrome c family protein
MAQGIRRVALGLAVLAALTGASSMRLGAQAPEPRIWQGVYNDAQVARGKEVFTNVCVRCHGTDLSGVTAPALKGDRFFQTFGSEPIDRLFLKVRDTMPPNYGDTVTDQNKLDAVTYVLQNNGFPSGPNELKMASEDLATALILRKGEQAVVQNFSLVSAVGCLAKGDGNVWLLTRSTDPVTTRDDTSTPQMLATAATRPLGTKTVRLLSAVPFKPEAHIGQRMEARGLIYNDAGNTRLTVVSLQVASDSCS